MFIYNKKLQYPVKIDKPNPKLAKIILTQYGGPDGELGASLRYLSQRYSMPFDDLKGLLTDIGTEELGHLEMIGAIVHQLTRNLTEQEMRDPAFAPYFVDNTLSKAVGVPPLCMYPNTVHLASKPVNASNSFATFWPAPPNLLLSTPLPLFLTFSTVSVPPFGIAPSGACI